MVMQQLVAHPSFAWLLELAERLGAEVLSLDSMLVYRGMDIGTAKPASAASAPAACVLYYLMVMV